MFQSFKRFWLVMVVLLGGAQGLFGFALLGPPNETYQVPTIGYNITTIAFSLGDVFTVDVGAPKNFQQGYRWNTPTNYYAYDASFATYYGSNGMAAVDQAFAMYNNLSNVSSYTKNLSEWPYRSSRVNFAAQSTSLLDLKSEAMELIIEQLGLASPDRYTWGLHDRFLPGGAMCPAYEYIVIQRNFDPVTQTYSSFVNNKLLGYTIIDLCPLTANPFAPFEADAAEYTTDPKDALTSVAAQTLDFGEFFIGFTRDDIGGLRDLYAATNVFTENAESNSFQLVTNSQVSLLTTSNLALFEAASLVDDDATLTALYPGLIITSTTNFFTNVVTTNVTLFLTNVIGAPAGTVTLAAATTLTTNVQLEFARTFGNVVILHTGGLANQVTELSSVTAQRVIGAPAGTITLTTNIIAVTNTTPFTNGDFYILPAGQCDNDVILGVQLATFTQTSNAVPVVTGGFGNVPQFFIAEVVNSFTNFTYLVRTVDCGTNTTSLKQGIEHLTFIRRDFDALLGTTWDPITNFYHLVGVSNTATVQTFRRVITRPDILFTTADLAAGPAAIPAVSAIARSVPNFDSTQATRAGQPGPGTIAPGVTLTFNNVGPAFVNAGPYFVNSSGVLGTPFSGSADTNSLFTFQWGSFDGTTNAPVVYPSSLSLASLQNEIYFQIITPSPLTNGVVGHAYSVQLQVTGGTQLPGGGYTFGTSVPGLPAGLRLSASGIISGTPTTAGTNTFTVQAMDAGQRVTSAVLSLGVTP